jgi:hypothetical protein
MTDEMQPGGLELNPQTRLCEDFALALHAMAQPLAVLRGALGALKLRGVCNPDADRYVELSNTQVERLCTLLSGMRSLVDSFQFDAVCAPTNLRELIASIIENEEASLDRRGVRISTAKADREVRVLADPERTEFAIEAVLAAVSAASSQGDEIYLTVEPRGGFADVTVQAPHADKNKLTSIDRLRFSVAEAGVRSQKGLFQYREDPLRISLKLPLDDGEGRRTEPAGLSRLVEQVQPERSFTSFNDQLITQGDDW